MQVQIENEYTGSDFSEILYFDYEKTAGDVVARVLSDAGCSYEAEVNILFTGEEEIREINSETRNMDRVTDVLSFPMHEYDTPGDFDELDPDGFDDFDPETGNLLLGDIVLCIPRVKSQAEEYGHSTLREFAFLDRIRPYGSGGRTGDAGEAEGGARRARHHERCAVNIHAGGACELLLFMEIA